MAVEPLPLRNRVYAVLVGVDGLSHLTLNFQLYNRLIGVVGAGDGQVVTDTVSRAFPSRLEASAYFAGAQHAEPALE